MLRYLESLNVNAMDIRNEYLPSQEKIIKFAFSAKRRKMGIVIKDKNNLILHEKGAAETILYSCDRIHFPNAI